MSYRTAGLALAGLACAPPVEPAEVRAELRVDGPADRDPESHGARLCAAGNGTVYALWLDDRLDPDVPELWMNVSFFHGDDATWLATPVRVNQEPPGTGVVSYDVWCDDLGVFVVWEEDREDPGGLHQIRFNRTVDLGATFLSADGFLDVRAGNSEAPRIGGDGDGLYVVWVENASDLLLSTSDNAGESWEFPFVVDGGVGDVGAHALQAGDGGAVVLWAQEVVDSVEVYAARAIPGGLNPATLLGREPAVAEVAACLDDGEAHALWDRGTDDEEGVWASSSADGGIAWAPSARLDATPVPSTGVRCAAGHAVWEEAGTIELRSDGTATTLGAGTATHPVLARDPLTGERAVVWTEVGSDGAAELYFSPGEGALRIDAVRSRKVDLDAAVRDGAVLALWIDDRNGTGDVYFARLPLDAMAR